MPYIEQKDRPQYAAALHNLTTLLKGKPKGHLTYVLYALALRYIPEVRYTAISNTISCVDDAADELRRRVLYQYEDAQMYKNGDVR